MYCCIRRGHVYRYGNVGGMRLYAALSIYRVSIEPSAHGSEISLVSGTASLAEAGVLGFLLPLTPNPSNPHFSCPPFSMN